MPQGGRQNCSQGDETGGEEAKCSCKEGLVMVWAFSMVLWPPSCFAVVNLSSCLALTVALESLGSLLGLL